MPPQMPPFNPEESVARLRAKQEERKDRIVQLKEAKAKVLRPKVDTLNVEPFDPEKHKLSGKDYASGEKDEKD